VLSNQADGTFMPTLFAHEDYKMLHLLNPVHATEVMFNFLKPQPLDQFYGTIRPFKWEVWVALIFSLSSIWGYLYLTTLQGNTIPIFVMDTFKIYLRLQQARQF